MTKNKRHKNSHKNDHILKIERGSAAIKQKKFFSTFKFSSSKIFKLSLILVPIILFSVWFSVFQTKHKDQFYSNVFVAGESIGGQTYGEALIYFKEKEEKFKNDGLGLSFKTSKGLNNFNIPMSMSGFTSDNSIEYFSLGHWELVLQEAYAFGRGSSTLLNLKEQATLLFREKKFIFPTTIQKEAVISLIENELKNSLKESVPAGFVFWDNKVSVSKEVAGERIVIENVLDTLAVNIMEFNTSQVEFITDIDVPEVTKERLEPFLDTVDNFSKKIDLLFKHEDHRWQVRGTKLVTWLTLNDENQIVVDREKLENYFNSTVSKAIESPPRNSRFEMRNGKLVEIVEGKSGFVVDMDKAIEDIEKIISETNKDSTKRIISVLIKTVEVPPKITKETIEKYFIRDLVGEISTSFLGSTADREHNIKIGAGAINGMIIAPGAEFSTVNAIGRVTEAEGYVKEMVIKENKTAKELGGGLCQIATTLFRLALNAGLNITERVNHRFVVHYYDPPGLDATIYGPHPDFRFVNDTGNYLLLQARVENKKVIMELYGHKDGRTVEISEPVYSNKIKAPETQYIESLDIPVGQTKCFEASHDGLTTDVLYTVKYSDGTVSERNFRSVYKPWQKKCLVGVRTLSSGVLLE